MGFRDRVAVTIRKGEVYTPKSTRDTCRTLIYAPNTEEINGIMKVFSDMNGLTFGEDVVGYSSLFFLYLTHRQSNGILQGCLRSLQRIDSVLCDGRVLREHYRCAGVPHLGKQHL